MQPRRLMVWATSVREVGPGCSSGSVPVPVSVSPFACLSISSTSKLYDTLGEGNCAQQHVGLVREAHRHGLAKPGADGPGGEGNWLWIREERRGEAVVVSLAAHMGLRSQ